MNVVAPNSETSSVTHASTCDGEVSVQSSSRPETPSGSTPEVIAVSTGSVSTTPSASSGSFFSRISKTVEHKLHEFRNEKLREKTVSVDDSTSSSFLGGSVGNIKVVSEFGSDNEPIFRADRKRASETTTPTIRPTSTSLSNSPSRKTSLAQDLAEFSSEIGNKIPKLSELRNRKHASKEHKSSFTLNSFLGRDDEGLFPDDLVTEEEGAIEAGVEAEEGVCILSSSNEDVTASYVPATPIKSQPASSNSDNTKLENQSQKNMPIVHLPAEFSSSGTPEYHPLFIFLIDAWNKVSKILPSLPWSRLISVIVVLCFILPIPRFLAGMIFGAFIACSICYGYINIFVTSDTTSIRRNAEESVRKQQRPVLLDLPSDGGALHYKVRLS